MTASRKFACYLSAFLIAAPFSAYAIDLSAARSVPYGDVQIDAAMKKARAGKDDFLAKLDNPPAGTSHYAVKVAIVDRGNSFEVAANPRGAEYFWLTDIHKDGDNGYTATLSNKPEMMKNVKLGQQISFNKDDIYDWSYMDKGSMQGNYTACAILISGPAADLQKFESTYNTKCQ